MQKRRNVPNADSTDSADDMSVQIEKLGTESLTHLVMCSASNNEMEQLEAVQSVRKLLSSDRNPPIDELIGCGMLPILVECLTKDDKLVYNSYIIYYRLIILYFPHFVLNITENRYILYLYISEWINNLYLLIYYNIYYL